MFTHPSEILVILYADLSYDNYLVKCLTWLERQGGTVHIILHHFRTNRPVQIRRLNNLLVSYALADALTAEIHLLTTLDQPSNNIGIPMNRL